MNTTDEMLSDDDEYKIRTYKELSAEFQQLYPQAIRAYQLIPLMYNRLTLIDKLSHKDAITKINNDHSHLSGYSTRNIRRYLPSGNPAVPRRVRPPCPKNSPSEIIEPEKLSNSQHEDRPPVNTDDGTSCIGNYGGGGGETTSAAGHQQLQDGLNEKEIINHDAVSEFIGKCEAALLLEKQEVERDLIKKNAAFVNDDETSTNEIRLAIPKEKFENVKAAMENSRDFVYLIFDKSGRLERAESDVLTETKK
jgi:hypothetical protein